MSNPAETINAQNALFYKLAAAKDEELTPELLKKLDELLDVMQQQATTAARVAAALSSRRQSMVAIRNEVADRINSKTRIILQ